MNDLNHNEKKFCPRCKEPKIREEFSNSNQTLDKLQGHCKECRKKTSKINYQKRKSYYRRWRIAHRKQKQDYDAKDGPIRRQKLKLEVINAYGEKCDCCGETILDFLTIDHIHGNGAQERRSKRIGSGRQFYLYLKKHNFPSGYRVLCHNCNFSAFQHNGTCIHKRLTGPIG